MESRIEKAAQKKKQGMNCAQAVACTYCDYAGIEESEMEALTQSFGAGIGGTMEGTCGAISGACVIAGLLNKNTSRAKAMKDANSIVTKFKERNSTITCKELKGIGTGKVLRDCTDCVRDAAEFLEETLAEGSVL